ncbi:unnamed protein product [Spirodela intermedia]|uniref:Protein kinase domain-containing protein n=1 Tax=Spirodela intermedia TaxID=51605 RepID=A0A7I8I8L5_SPIIN|nr:unnamed protein product [Spirodela intermedia]CAA6653763.1 unnamed protein product [Spirodela intermedia]
MSDEVLMHLSSNSNPSDSNLPIKIAKLEARMAGKATSSTPVQSTSSTWQSSSSVKFGRPEELSEPSTSSDSDNDNGEEFLIQANTQKRQRTQEDESKACQLSEACCCCFHIFIFLMTGTTDVKVKIAETAEVRLTTDGSSKSKQGRGRGRSGTGRGVDQRTMIHCVFLAVQHLQSTSSVEETPLLRDKVASLEEELNKSRQESIRQQQLCCQLEKELKDLKEHDRQMKMKRIKVLSDLLIAVSKAERQEARIKTQQESMRLGNVGVIRAGTIVSETWEDGQALKDINSHLRFLLETKEAIERHRKTLRKRQSDKGDGSDELVISEEDFLIQDEICKSRLASIKREEESSMRERDRYEVEKGRLIREMKRIRDEDGSRFNSFQILNNRYALMNLLGKGGFSEVYKAFDLVDYRYVACKLHGLNPQWSEEKKKSYIRHATREYDIHKTLVHPHIVRLWDIFEIDHDTFCTVLEYCNGKDLDAVLKATPILPEREARIIIVQIFQGLVYLNKRPQKIIHYDLKPGNVLFDEVGIAKLTDFGLSKIVEDDVGSQGVELTSQGAGTYWYLPPECFECSKTPLISSKVDVWSAGVILYQMLFGKRPFGHDQSQERILREATIVNARKVEFPSRPAVSNEVKELIRRCLTYNQVERPDVLTLAQDPYLSYAKK